ncbi:DeoR/GlpR family DNA-binding transcription regulator [Arthrobacter sp. TMT4-20]
MFAEERHSKIATLAVAEGRVSVAELAERFNITRETVRRDLALLEDAGVLRRVHGGAVTGGYSSTSELSLNSRAGQHQNEKARIAKAALAMIPDAGSIVLDAGTTTGHLAELLAHEARADLVVITHAVPIAQSIASSNLHLELVGGRVRGLTSAAVGSHTIDRFHGYRPDIAFIGANGVHSTFGLSTPDPDEAAVKTAIVRSARRVIAVVDASKLEQETLVGFASLTDIDTLVTDRTPPSVLAAALADADVEVVVA